MSPQKEVRIAVNGYGVIGKRVAEAITLQDDMNSRRHIGCGDRLADAHRRAQRL